MVEPSEVEAGRAAAFEILNDGILVLDEQGRVVDNNARAAEILGISGDLTGVGLDKLERLIPGLKARLNQAGSISWESSLSHYDGRREIEVQVRRVAGFARLQAGFLVVLHDITDRMQTRQALESSEANFRNVIARSADGMVILDPDGRVLFANPAAVSMFDASNQDLVGSTFGFPLVREETAELEILPHGSRETARIVEMWVVDVEWEGLPALLASLRDITDRKRVENELRNSQEKFARLFRLAPDVITISSIADGRYIDVNEAFLKVSGYTRDEVIGRTSVQLNNWTSPEDRMRFVRTLLEVGRVRSQEIKFRIKSGASLTFLISADRLIVDDQEWILSILKDVTEQKQAQLELQESQAKFRRLVEQSRDGIVLTDEQGVVIEWNRGQENITGLKREQVLGKFIWDVQFEAGLNKNSAAYRDLRTMFTSLLEDEASPFFGRLTDRELIDQTGERRTIQSMIFPIRSGRGLMLGGVSRDVTETHRVGLALREAERRLAQILGTLAEGVIVIDLHGRITYANPSAKRILQVPLSIMGESVFSQANQRVFDANGVEIPVDNWPVFQALQSGKPSMDVEMAFRLRDGETIWLSVNSSPLIDENGTLYGGMASFRDVTKRVRVEKALARELEINAALAGLSRAMLGSMSLNQVMVMVLDYACRLTGSQTGMVGCFDPRTGEMLGTPLMSAAWGVYRDPQVESTYRPGSRFLNEIIESRHPIIVNQAVSGAGAANGDDSKEGVFRRYAGVPAMVGEQLLGMIIVANAARLYSDEDLDVLERLSALFVPAIQSIRAEQQLRELSMAVEQSPVSIVITDTRGQIEYVNKKFAEVTGYSAEEAIGQNPRILKSGKVPAEEYTRLWKTILRGEDWHGEFLNRKKSGELYWEDAVITPVLDVQGMITHFLAIKEDITELKMMRDRMLAAQKLADLGTLAAGVAHEINSPLQVITGMSKSLIRRIERKEADLETVKAELEVMHRNGWRVAEIVRALRTYAHVAPAQFARHDLNELIRDTLLLIEHQLRNWSRVEIKTTLAPDLPEILCDPNQISQVVINLISNARDAMPDGGLIQLETGVLSDQERVFLDVSDSGFGIPPEIRERIFDPFFTTKAPGQGTGLGLSIVSGIVGAHLGEIRVESQPGRGARFRVLFPLQADLSLTQPPAGGRYESSGAGFLVKSKK
jgi:PAS domain S-box-containing protein